MHVASPPFGALPQNLHSEIYFLIIFLFVTDPNFKNNILEKKLDLELKIDLFQYYLKHSARIINVLISKLFTLVLYGCYYY